MTTGHVPAFWHKLAGMITPDDILAFWFREIDGSAWWRKDAAFDLLLRERFGTCHEVACGGGLWSWRESAPGRLAEVIVLDQFSRNIHRDTPQAFAQDGMALVLAQELIRSGQAAPFTLRERGVLYLPFMHSESLAMQDESVRLYSEPGLDGQLDFALQHRDIIARFGRFPHRNAILGRASTAEELAFLQEPGSSF